MFEVVTFLAITTQSNRRSLTCPLLKGLVFQMAVSPPHPSWACSRAISEGSLYIQKLSLRYLSPVTPASFLPHVYVLCCTAVTFLLILY